MHTILVILDKYALNKNAYLRLSVCSPGFHAGGLRYHGMAPLVSHLVNEGFIQPEAYNQTDIFSLVCYLRKLKGSFLPGANHAVKGAIESALECKLKGEKKLSYLICGHGYFDMQAYIDYFDNKLLITSTLTMK